MARVLTFANIARWIIGSILAGATAAVVTLVVAAYAADENTKRIEAAVEGLSTKVTGLETQISSLGAISAEGDDERALVTELRGLVTELRERVANPAEAPQPAEQ